MAYPPRPGASSSSASSSGPSSHPSLPARPPPPKPSRFKPAFTPTGSAPQQQPSSAVGRPPSYPAAPYATHNPHPPLGAAAAPPHQRYGASYPAPSYGVGAAVPPAMSAPPPPYGAQAYSVPSASSSSYGPARPSHQPFYGGTAAQNAATAAPSIRNPFPSPAQQDKNSEYDPDMAAQIAQWQSAYGAAPDAGPDSKNGRPLFPGGGPGAAAGGVGVGGGGFGGIDPAAAAGALPYGTIHDPNFPPPLAGIPAAANPSEKKKTKTVAREGGGKKWTDDTLLEWDPSHFRLFVGNLAGETTDESLLKAFARWGSVSKARVIREKRTTKSKGFGFVSFSDADDFFQAAKEMNGKYIQSHPVIVKRSTTEIKATNSKNNNSKGHHGNNNKYKNKNKNREGSFEPHLGPQPGNGIQKSGQKTKGGLKLLG